jgi:tetratricopeptide (TPR) repeat protein
MRTSSFAAIFLLIGCAHRGAIRYPEADRVELDILRSHPGAEKLYVQARLSDGSQGLFMVDTGAGITAITQELADRLGIEGLDTGRTLQGLGGETPLIRGELKDLAFKGLHMGPVEVAIGVPGIPSHAGWMPVDGIIGNNVWGQLQMAIDYPADILELGRPGTIPFPDSAQDVFFDGRHLVVEALLKAGTGDAPVTKTLQLELDTGARGILLSGDAGRGFEGLASEGEEPIFGVGASEDVPVSAFYRRTRHVPIQSVVIGGRTVESPLAATWINYGQGAHVGPQDLNGLLGHAVVSDFKLMIDFPNRKLALVPSTREARQNNGHSTLLKQDQDRHGRSKARGLFRAKMRLAKEDYAGAEKELRGFLKSQKGNGEALSLLARIRRMEGDLEGYMAILDRLSPEAMAREGELVGAVNTLLLGGKVTEARQLANQAVKEAPDEPGAHIALYELHMHLGQYADARAALKRARKLKENPDAFLMRRSRLSLRESDAFGTASHLRRRLALYPSDGFALWAYALTFPQEGDAPATFKADMKRALSRLHPDMLPLDFAAAAHLILGESQKSVDLIQQGIARDCEKAEPAQEKQNCEAWYRAMGSFELDLALSLVDQALATDPHRPDFLDTKAVIHWRRGELEAAEIAAIEAVRLKPSDIYHLWQLDRIRVIRSAKGSSQ